MNTAVRQTKIRCVIYRTTSIGDVILATATLDVLRRLEIPHEVHWVTRNPAFALLQASYPDYHFYEISDDEAARKVYEELTKLEHLHFILDLQKSIRSRRFCARLAAFHNCPMHTWDKHSVFRAKLILNARLRGRSQPAPAEVYQPSFQQFSAMSAPMITALRELLPELNFDQVRKGQARPHLDLTQACAENDTAWNHELSVGRWLAVAPGASYLAKKAPSEFYRTVLNGLRQKIAGESMELGLLYLGNQDDRVDALAIADAISWPFPSLNLCGKLSLVESGIALTRVKGILGNDSSLGHIAEALGIPSAVIYGPTAEGFGFPPWRPESAAHSVPLGCRPCSKHGQKACRYGDLKCYADIDRERVTQHVFQMVKQS